jgi:mercuric ion transport protein
MTLDRTNLSNRATGHGALLTGGLAAILASTCCLGTLLLVMLGFSGAWIGNLTALEPYRPIFIGVAVTSLLFASWQIWGTAVCASGKACASPRAARFYKLLFGVVTVLVLIALGYPYVAPFFY